MSARPQWSYVQARLQARHGDRLGDDEWAALEAAKSIDQLIERSRATALRCFCEALQPRMSSHLIERLLRIAWRSYVAEAAAWVPGAWRAAVLWAGNVPELPVIAALLDGEAPDWTRQDPLLDPLLAALVESDPRRRSAAVERSSFAPLVTRDAGRETLAMRWFAHWRTLWPAQRQVDERALIDLARAIMRHLERLARASPQETSSRYRREVASAVTRIFRRASGTPAALFCHLVLVALDVERLRGGLVRRRLFGPEHATASA